MNQTIIDKALHKYHLLLMNELLLGDVDISDYKYASLSAIRQKPSEFFILLFPTKPVWNDSGSERWTIVVKDGVRPMLISKSDNDRFCLFEEHQEDSVYVETIERSLICLKDVVSGDFL